MNNQLKIFTDGSCLGNPGPGGYGVIIQSKKFTKIISAGYFMTTNNRMEIMAPIAGLNQIEKKKKINIIIITDSNYLYQGINNWIYRWKKTGWINYNKKPIKNADLWNKLYKLIQNYNIKWKCIKGHTGNFENEKCDKLARLAASNPLYEDYGYKFL